MEYAYPPIGIDPNIYRPQPEEPLLINPINTSSRPSKKQKPSFEGSSLIYGAVYSGIPVYEMMCRNVAVMRRKNDSYLNATQILKVAGIDKGRRTKILEKEILPGIHEKVQGGYGKYQGTWIPFERGVQVAEQYGVAHLLAPLFEQPSTVTPTKEAAHREMQERMTQEVQHHPPPDEGLLLQNYEDYYDASSRHGTAMMAMFLSDDPAFVPDFLHPSCPLPGDFDIDMILDDQGHTAIHWAAALARISVLDLLIQRGANLLKQNYAGETALMRAVMVPNNFDLQSFSDLLHRLRDSILMADFQKRTVFHHIVLTAKVKGKSSTARYYMECLIEYLQKESFPVTHLVNLMDFEGNTALNIAARIGNRQLVQQLLDAGADKSIENVHGLKPTNFIDMSSTDSSVVFPTIKTSQDMQPQDQDDRFEILSKELIETRRINAALKTQVSHIPELILRINQLEKSLDEALKTPPMPSNSDYAKQLESNEARLRAQIIQQTNSQQEVKCKRIIAACCNLPLEQVDDLINPLLEAVESDDPDMDISMVNGFLSRVRSF